MDGPQSADRCTLLGIRSYHGTKNSVRGSDSMEKIVFIWGQQGSYGNYVRAIQAAGGYVCLSENLRDASCCGGLLLPGGGDLEPWRYGRENIASKEVDSERDQIELGLLGRFLGKKRPVLGICRGLQVINVAFGGTLLQDLPGHSTVAGVDRLHSVHTAPSILRTLYGETSIVNSAHHQAIERLGADLEAIQWAPDGTVEALIHRNLPIWAVQWHPERLRGRWTRAGAADGGRIFQAFLAACPHS